MDRFASHGGKLDAGHLPSTGPSDAEPARAFLQDRIRLWTFSVFALSSAFFLINVGSWPLMRHTSTTFAAMMLHVSNLDHLVATLMFGGVWLMTRHGRWRAAARR